MKINVLPTKVRSIGVYLSSGRKVTVLTGTRATGDVEATEKEVDEQFASPAIESRSRVSLRRLSYWWEKYVKPYITQALESLDNKMNTDGSNYIASLAIVTPSISSSWIVRDQSGTQKTTSSASSISVENGAKVDYKGSWKWSAGAGKKNPTRTSGTWGTDIPSSGESSEDYESLGITSSKTMTQTIYANKSGLEVSGSKVVKATGEDSASASASVSFYHRRYWGANSEPKASVSSLSSELSNSKAKTINYDCSGGKYFYYALPKALATSISAVVGGLSYSGWESWEEEVTNEYGKKITYCVWRSGAIQQGSSINVVIS